MIWYVPDGFSENQLLVWFLFWHTAFFTFISVINAFFTKGKNSNSKKRNFLRAFEFHIQRLPCLLVAMKKKEIQQQYLECVSSI